MALENLAASSFLLSQGHIVGAGPAGFYVTTRELLDNAIDAGSSSAVLDISRHAARPRFSVAPGPYRCADASELMPESSTHLFWRIAVADNGIGICKQKIADVATSIFGTSKTGKLLSEDSCHGDATHATSGLVGVLEHSPLPAASAGQFGIGLKAVLRIAHDSFRGGSSWDAASIHADNAQDKLFPLVLASLPAVAHARKRNEASCVKIGMSSRAGLPSVAVLSPAHDDEEAGGARVPAASCGASEPDEAMSAGMLSCNLPEPARRELALRRVPVLWLPDTVDPELALRPHDDLRSDSVGSTSSEEKLASSATVELSLPAATEPAYAGSECAASPFAIGSHCGTSASVTLGSDMPEESMRLLLALLARRALLLSDTSLIARLRLEGASLQAVLSALLPSSATLTAARAASGGVATRALLTNRSQPVQLPLFALVEASRLLQVGAGAGRSLGSGSLTQDAVTAAFMASWPPTVSAELKAITATAEPAARCLSGLTSRGGCATSSDLPATAGPSLPRGRPPEGFQLILRLGGVSAAVDAAAKEIEMQGHDAQADAETDHRISEPVSDAGPTATRMATSPGAAQAGHCDDAVAEPVGELAAEEQPLDVEEISLDTVELTLRHLRTLFDLPPACVAAATAEAAVPLPSLPTAPMQPTDSTDAALPGSSYNLQQPAVVATVYAVLSPATPAPKRSARPPLAAAGKLVAGSATSGPGARIEQAREPESDVATLVDHALRSGNACGVLHVLRFVNGMPLLGGSSRCSVARGVAAGVDWSDFGLVLTPVASLATGGRKTAHTGSRSGETAAARGRSRGGATGGRSRPKGRGSKASSGTVASGGQTVGRKRTRKGAVPATKLGNKGESSENVSGAAEDGAVNAAASEPHLGDDAAARMDADDDSHVPGSRATPLAASFDGPGEDASGDSDFPLLASTGAQIVLAARAAALRSVAGAGSAAGRGIFDTPPTLPRSAPRLPPRVLRLLDDNGAAPLVLPHVVRGCDRAARRPHSCSSAPATGSDDAASAAYDLDADDASDTPSGCPVAVTLGTDAGIDADGAMLCVSAAADESVLARIKGVRQVAGAAASGAGRASSTLAAAGTADTVDAVVPFRCLRLIVEVTLRPPMLETRRHAGLSEAACDAGASAVPGSKPEDAPGPEELEFRSSSCATVEHIVGPIPVAFGSFTKTWIAGTATTRRLAEAGCTAATEVRRRQRDAARTARSASTSGSGAIGSRSGTRDHDHDSGSDDSEAAVMPPEANFDGVAEATAAAAAAALEQLRAQLPGLLVSVRHQQLRLLREAFLPSIAAELAAVVRTARAHAQDAEAQVAAAELSVSHATETDLPPAQSGSGSLSHVRRPTGRGSSVHDHDNEFADAELLDQDDHDDDASDGHLTAFLSDEARARQAHRRDFTVDDSGMKAAEVEAEATIMELRQVAADRRKFATSCLAVGIHAEIDGADSCAAQGHSNSSGEDIWRLRCLLERQLQMVVDSALALEADALDAGASSSDSMSAAAAADTAANDGDGPSADASSHSRALEVQPKAESRGCSLRAVPTQTAATSSGGGSRVSDGASASESHDTDTNGVDPFAQAILRGRQQRRLLELQEAQAAFRARVKESGGTLGLPVPQRRRRVRLGHHDADSAASAADGLEHEAESLSQPASKAAGAGISMKATAVLQHSRAGSGDARAASPAATAATLAPLMHAEMGSTGSLHAEDRHDDHDVEDHDGADDPWATALRLYPPWLAQEGRGCDDEYDDDYEDASDNDDDTSVEDGFRARIGATARQHAAAAGRPRSRSLSDSKSESDSESDDSIDAALGITRAHHDEEHDDASAWQRHYDEDVEDDDGSDNEDDHDEASRRADDIATRGYPGQYHAMGRIRAEKDAGRGRIQAEKDAGRGGSHLFGQHTVTRDRVATARHRDHDAASVVFAAQRTRPPGPPLQPAGERLPMGARLQVGAKFAASSGSLRGSAAAAQRHAISNVAPLDPFQDHDFEAVPVAHVGADGSRAASTNRPAAADEFGLLVGRVRTITAPAPALGSAAARLLQSEAEADRAFPGHHDDRHSSSDHLPVGRDSGLQLVGRRQVVMSDVRRPLDASSLTTAVSAEQSRQRECAAAAAVDSDSEARSRSQRTWPEWGGSVGFGLP